MSTVKELIRTEADGSVSFGDYELDAKTKRSDYEHEGDIYKVKTYKDITRLEKNDSFIYESVPGTAVSGLKFENGCICFKAEGPEDADITLGLAEASDYEVVLNGASAGVIKTNLGGKLTFAGELSAVEPVAAVIKKA